MLAKLAEQGPYVVKLPREPGKRESRYAHLFSGEVDLQALAEAAPASSYASPAADRLTALEEEVERLTRAAATAGRAPGAAGRLTRWQYVHQEAPRRLFCALFLSSPSGEPHGPTLPQARP